MPFCSKCGTEVPIDISFCSKCGNKLQGEQDSTPTPTTPKVEVSTQSDETKPTLYNPIAVALWGLISPPVSCIILYLNFKILMQPKNNEPEEKDDIFGNIDSQKTSQVKALNLFSFICFGMAAGNILFMYIFPLLKGFKITFLMGLVSLSLCVSPFLIAYMQKTMITTGYNKKPLLIPVIIMIVAEVIYVALTHNNRYFDFLGL